MSIATQSGSGMKTQTHIEPGIGDYSSYELAILRFTSSYEIGPSVKDDFISTEFILTAKESYLWAGTLVYILTERTSLEEEVISEILRKTFASFKGQLNGEILAGVSSAEIIKMFLTQFGIAEEKFDEIIQVVTEAKEKLEKEGLIEDPLKKKILGFSIAVLSILPVNFTSKTEKGIITEKKIHALLWDYESTFSEDSSEATFNLKIIKIADFFINDALPAALDILKEGEANDTPKEDK